MEQNTLMLTSVLKALPEHWSLGRGVSTRKELLREILGIMWVARHDPDERVAKHHIMRKIDVLQQLYTAIWLLDFGEVLPLLSRRTFNNRPTKSSPQVVMMAILAAAFAALRLVGVARSDAAHRIASLANRRRRPSDRTSVTSGTVYRYWRRVRGSLEFDLLLMIIMSSGRCSLTDFTANQFQKIDLLGWGASESSVIKETAATLDRFLVPREK